MQSKIFTVCLVLFIIESISAKGIHLLNKNIMRNI